MMIFAVIMMSCNPGTPDERLNAEAIALHNSMITKAALIRNRLKALKSDSTVSRDSVRVLLGLLAQWERDLVEVPGNEDHGDHDHGPHHHDHAPSEVTPRQMLDIQKTLDATLSRIGKRTTQLKPHNEESHQH